MSIGDYVSVNTNLMIIVSYWLHKVKWTNDVLTHETSVWEVEETCKVVTTFTCVESDMWKKSQLSHELEHNMFTFALFENFGHSWSF